MKSRHVLASLAAALVMLATPTATAATVGPNPAYDPAYPDAFTGTTFDLDGEIPGGYPDDNTMVDLDVAGQSCTLIDDTLCTVDEPLTVGATYHAIVHESYIGHWYCSMYNESGCSWLDDDDEYREYVFTYTGQTQKLVRWYAPVKIAISRKKSPTKGRWIVGCAVRRDGAVSTGRSVAFQWRDRKHRSWHTAGTFKTNGSGVASANMLWTGAKGSMRCTTAGDWHTASGLSAEIAMTTRRR